MDDYCDDFNFYEQRLEKENKALQTQNKKLVECLKETSKEMRTVFISDSKGAWMDFEKQMEKVDELLKEGE